MKQKPHIPVLLEEVLKTLGPFEDALVVDGTFGAGGYSQAFLEKGAKVIAFDRDPDAIAAGAFLQERYKDQLTLVNKPFSHLEDVCTMKVDMVVFDVGVSSMQIDQAERGFSFQKEGPLDMRMGQQGPSAADVVNNLPAKALARIFHKLGEERYATSIARLIEERRRKKPFTTTRDLAQLIEAMVPPHVSSRLHPATRVFQALRIFVNDELQELITALFAAEKILKAGGRLGVVSFHSLEDRIVKQFFLSRTSPASVSRYIPVKEDFSGSFSLLFKGAITPTAEEMHNNPRARSAKLRAGLRTAANTLEEDKMIFKLPILQDIEEMKHAYL